jgi:hypothetical protein
MPNPSMIEGWIRVPDNSTCEFVVTGTTAAATLTASLEMLDANGVFTERILDTAHGQPFSKTLRKPHRRYSADILLHFDTAATAHVQVRVLDSSNQLYGRPYDQQITGGKGADKFVSFFAMMRK